MVVLSFSESMDVTLRIIIVEIGIGVFIPILGII